MFLHLEPIYRNRVWVLLDFGDRESAIITKMKERYEGAGWSPNNFRQLGRHDFEDYYPDEFSDEVQAIRDLDKKDAQTIRNEKAKLIEKVKSWCRENREEAVAGFVVSAAEVIAFLKEIEIEMAR